MSKTYTHVVPIECSLPGYHSDFDIYAEVEFTVSQFSEINGVRILAEEPKPGKPRLYVDACAWLLNLVESHLDIDQLVENVEPDEGPDPDDERDRRIDEALMYGRNA